MNIIPDPQVTRFDHQNPEVRLDPDFRVDRGGRQALVRPIIEQQQQQQINIQIRNKKKRKKSEKSSRKKRKQDCYTMCVCMCDSLSLKVYHEE